MGGPLHVAVLGLLADSYHHLGMYDEAITTLAKLRKSIGTEAAAVEDCIEFATVKSMFFKGDFDGALDRILALLEVPKIKTSPLSRTIIMNTQGIIKLVSLDTEDTTEEQLNRVIEILQEGANHLKDVDSGAASAAFNNLGVAIRFSKSVLLQSSGGNLAMDKFHTALEKAESSQQDQNSLLKGTIYSNMAQTLLDDQEIDDSSLKKASKYAKESMLIYQQGSSSSGISEPERKVGFGRALSLVAACYEKADSAILAEGLYQTSIENFSDRHPLSKISHAGILNYYAKLCKKWDKR
eukprot:CAMPEP_0194179514 /NCGR_PEP_ID=MMETSP0154-20130528/12949_1 /TAXON_ID=1049557 /ORGANISM="Thalassiothrix antarctica, Strain L6-D1" /LENGTH=295 /DNA_ID=CAMNT_0038894887 /DNA_START=283 /DNA_END=1167 /DNA_ORIENTATION=+